MSRPGHHTVLPEWHLREYFGGQRFENYDLQDRKWKSVGPRSFGRIRAYYEDEIESELGKIENDARDPVMKLAQRCTLGDEDRRRVARYIAASLFRNSSMFDELLPEILENFKRTLFSENATEIPDVAQREVDTYVGRLTNDEDIQREMHGAWSDHAEEFPLIAKRIYDLSWHILYVARKPNNLLLTDRPFIVHAPTDRTQALFTFPISSEVMLHINYDPRERWHVEPMERDQVIRYGRLLVARAKRFVAAPFQDQNLTNMIERVRAAKSAPAT